MMNMAFYDTPSELASYEFYKTKKEVGENIPVENILHIILPFKTKQLELLLRRKLRLNVCNDTLLPEKVLTLQL